MNELVRNAYNVTRNNNFTIKLLFLRKNQTEEKKNTTFVDENQPTDIRRTTYPKEGHMAEQHYEKSNKIIKGCM